MHPGSDEDNTLRTLAYILQICQRSGSKRNLVRAQGIIPTLANLLKSSSRRVQLKSLQVLRAVVEDNDQNKEELGKGDTVRTIIMFLSNEHIQERELAVSLMYELSEYEPLRERIGAVSGAILQLVGMGSTKSEDMMAVEKAEKTLKNLEMYDTNIKQMAENGRLQPLLTKLLEGGPEVQVTMVEYLRELASVCSDYLAADLECHISTHLELLLEPCRAVTMLNDGYELMFT